MAIFHYPTGEIVKLRDTVKTGNGNIGKVVNIFNPKSQGAKDFSCEEEGGVLIEEDWDGKASHLLMVPPDGESWEDLKFISRNEAR